MNSLISDSRGNEKHMFLCRGCLAAKNLKPMNNNLLKLFGEITGTPVNQEDIYPKYICSTCLVFVRKFVKFRKKCQYVCNTLHTMALWNKMTRKSVLLFNNPFKYELQISGTENMTYVHQPKLGYTDILVFDISSGKAESRQFKRNKNSENDSENIIIDNTSHTVLQNSNLPVLEISPLNKLGMLNTVPIVVPSASNLKNQNIITTLPYNRTPVSITQPNNPQDQALLNCDINAIRPSMKDKFLANYPTAPDPIGNMDHLTVNDDADTMNAIGGNDSIDEILIKAENPDQGISDDPLKDTDETTDIKTEIEFETTDIKMEIEFDDNIVKEENLIHPVDDYDDDTAEAVSNLNSVDETNKETYNKDLDESRNDAVVEIDSTSSDSSSSSSSSSSDSDDDNNIPDIDLTLDDEDTPSQEEIAINKNLQKQSEIVIQKTTVGQEKHQKEIGVIVSDALPNLQYFMEIEPIAKSSRVPNRSEKDAAIESKSVQNANTTDERKKENEKKESVKKLNDTNINTITILPHTSQSLTNDSNANRSHPNVEQNRNMTSQTHPSVTIESLQKATKTITVKHRDEDNVDVSSEDDDLPDCLFGFNADIYKKDVKRNFPDFNAKKPNKIKFVDMTTMSTRSIFRISSEKIITKEKNLVPNKESKKRQPGKITKKIKTNVKEVKKRQLNEKEKKELKLKRKIVLDKRKEEIAKLRQRNKLRRKQEMAKRIQAMKNKT